MVKEHEKSWFKEHPILTTIIALAILITFIIYLSIIYQGSNDSDTINQETIPGFKPDRLDNTYCDNITYENLVCHSDGIGNYICQGIAYNNCDEPMSYVKVIGTYFDKDGNFIGTSWAYTDPNTIREHSSAPFTLYTTENGVIFDTYKIQFTWH